MALKPSQVRRRLSAALDLRLGADWYESASSFDAFPNLDSRDILDRCYVVGLGPTRTISEDTRQRRSRALVVRTEVRVRMSSNIITTAQGTGYDQGLDREQMVLQAAMAANKDPDLEVVFDGVTARRVVLQDTCYLAEMRFQVLHGLDLA